MAKLGSFGAAIREIDPARDRDEFDYFGETFDVVGVIPQILGLKICAGMVGALSGIDQDAALYESLRHALTAPPAEEGARPDRSRWDRFYQLAVKHSGDDTDLARIVFAILGAQSGFPTVQRSTSDDGSPETSPNSNSSSSASPASPHLVPVATVLGG